MASGNEEGALGNLLSAADQGKMAKILISKGEKELEPQLTEEEKGLLGLFREGKRVDVASICASGLLNRPKEPAYAIFLKHVYSLSAFEKSRHGDQKEQAEYAKHAEWAKSQMPRELSPKHAKLNALLERYAMEQRREMGNAAGQEKQLSAGQAGGPAQAAELQKPRGEGQDEHHPTVHIRANILEKPAAASQPAGEPIGAGPEERAPKPAEAGKILERRVSEAAGAAKRGTSAKDIKYEAERAVISFFEGKYDAVGDIFNRLTKLHTREIETFSKFNLMKFLKDIYHARMYSFEDMAAKVRGGTESGRQRQNAEDIRRQIEAIFGGGVMSRKELAAKYGITVKEEKEERKQQQEEAPVRESKAPPKDYTGVVSAVAIAGFAIAGALYIGRLWGIKRGAKMGGDAITAVKELRQQNQGLEQENQGLEQENQGLETQLASLRAEYSNGLYAAKEGLERQREAYEQTTASLEGRLDETNKYIRVIQTALEKAKAAPKGDDEAYKRQIEILEGRLVEETTRRDGLQQQYDVLAREKEELGERLNQEREPAIKTLVVTGIRGPVIFREGGLTYQLEGRLLDSSEDIENVDLSVTMAQGKGLGIPKIGDKIPVHGLRDGAYTLAPANARQK